MERHCCYMGSFDLAETEDTGSFFPSDLVRATLTHWINLGAYARNCSGISFPHESSAGSNDRFWPKRTFDDALR